ncbi:MAG TPA: FYDLN acid domain-containing protein [Thermoanaerobaculia bacterium]|nr:FYDLN acid domain-containing protein [Thermoanaerobaculia bacterium]
MPELKLGNKFECFSCGTKFYDLGKTDPLCPKCGANQKNAAQAESPAASSASRRKRKAEIPKPIEVEEEEPIEIPDEEIVAPEVEEGLAEEEEEDLEDES